MLTLAFHVGQVQCLVFILTRNVVYILVTINSLHYHKLIYPVVSALFEHGMSAWPLHSLLAGHQ